MSAVFLASVYKKIREAKDELAAQASKIEVQLKAATQLLIDQYEAEGTTMVRLAEGGSVAVQIKPHATVVDLEANRQWAIQNGLEKLLRLPWATVNTLTGERLLAGEAEPEGVTCYAESHIVFRSK